MTIAGALALLVCLVVLLGASGSEPAYAVGEDYKLGQVIVKLNPVLGTHIDEINADYDTRTRDASLATMHVYLLELPDNSEGEETFAERLTNDKRVLYAEPNFVAEAPEAADARMRARGISGTRTSGSDSSDRYAARSLNLACKEHDINRGQGVTVAVLDTGAQLDHPALKANFEGVRRYDFVGDDTNPTDRRVGLDEDGDGLKDELRGHGTHVAGIVDRVAPAAKIMPLRVLDSEGFGDAYKIARAVSYAQRNGADVMNLSLGTSRRSNLLQEMIGNAIAKGVVVVAAAGNSRKDEPHYPAAGNYPVSNVSVFLPFVEKGLLAVTSVNKDDFKSGFATYGLWVDISAPGQGIRSAFPTSVYANWSGTSMSAPFVSGQAALIRTADGSLDPEGVENTIRSTSRSIYPPEKPDQEISHIGKLGAGHADVCKSLESIEGG